MKIWGLTFMVLNRNKERGFLHCEGRDLKEEKFSEIWGGRRLR